MFLVCTQYSTRRRHESLDAIEASKISHIPRNVLRQLFEIVLRCNVFNFDGQIYKQIQGTAMGTKMAPSYANLFMDRFERAFLAQEPIQPPIWKRYIDDILCVWTGTRSELESFLDRLNKAHRTLKFTWSISDERIEFLDLNLFKGGRFNTTNLPDISTHLKKTNTFQYLHFSSSHPRSVFKGLVKGEAIRFLCSNTVIHTKKASYCPAMLRFFPAMESLASHHPVSRTSARATHAAFP